ncbi:sugar phosphate isomerase/epimerase family protein [Thalassoglobus polymorphus]|uniref:Inosose dehydratase n=1 Tax=Thalassoglobus polymorphus TaxID=2527994 RepID=A0A517QSD1_9PLAN|nr:sugar phosphate isomerase/epimerase family protein [Thalassoglobus polymorphus]QDT34515.1 Inosose dehydratase [Thalassoglobus polymorphus]
MQTALYGSIGWKHPFGIFQVLEWAKEYGWDSVDARGMTIDIPGGPKKQLTAFGYDMLGPRQIRPTAREQLRSRCEELGIPIICLYVPSPVNLRGKLGEDCRRLFKEFVQLAADVGIEWVRAINNTTESYNNEPFTEEEAFARTVDGLKEVGKFAADLGVGILIENNENTTTSCAAELLTMKSEVVDACRMGIAYDGTNAYFQGLKEMEELKKLAGAIDVLHLKNVKRHDDPTFSYLPRGDFSYEWTSLEQGDVRWDKFLKQAVADGFDGPLTFEYVNPFKGMPADYWNILREPEKAAAEEIAYIKKVLNEIAE